MKTIRFKKEKHGHSDVILVATCLDELQLSFKSDTYYLESGSKAIRLYGNEIIAIADEMFRVFIADDSALQNAFLPCDLLQPPSHIAEEACPVLFADEPMKDNLAFLYESEEASTQAKQFSHSLSCMQEAKTYREAEKMIQVHSDRRQNEKVPLDLIDELLLEASHTSSFSDTQLLGTGATQKSSMGKIKALLCN